jgi:hypothetical protein
MKTTTGESRGRKYNNIPDDPEEESEEENRLQPWQHRNVNIRHQHELRNEIASPVIYRHRPDREFEDDENTYQLRGQPNRARKGNSYPVQAVRIHQSSERIKLEGWTMEAFRNLQAAYARRDFTFDEVWEGSVCLTFDQRVIALLSAEMPDFYDKNPIHSSLFFKGQQSDRAHALENDKEYFMDIIKFTCGVHDHANGEHDFGALNRRLSLIKMEYFKGTNNIVVTNFCVKIIHQIQEANLRMTTNQTKTCLESIIRSGIRQNYSEIEDPVMMDLAKHMRE